MNCNCCGLSLEVLDGSPFCHYCYLRECVVNPGRCENARLREGELMEDGELIDQIDEAIHTDGEKLSDEQVLDYIEKLLEKRGKE